MKLPSALTGCLLLLHVATLHGAPPADYVAHEWGTFTSVQGSDGVQMDWNPLTTTELPKFVYDRSRPRRGVNGLVVVQGKSGTIARQRLETPVIYFYSKQARDVSARVAFPEGSITEWYPQQNPAAPVFPKAGEPAARWEHLHVLAPAATPPAPPQEATGSHYYAARLEEANSVQMTVPPDATETEKFVFYRGVGRFTAPLTVGFSSEPSAGKPQALTLQNAGAEPLTSLLVYEVRGATARFAWTPMLRTGERRDFRFPLEEFQPLSEVRGKLETELQAALTKAGLYEWEAAAMIRTWDEAWFAEGGLRVLYLLPRSWTDRTLPLTLEPKPREVTRVMVGRAEVLTPAVEGELQTLIEHYQKGDEAARQQAVAAAQALQLGRFAEPAVRRVSAAHVQDREFLNAGWQLLTDAYAKPVARPPLARQN